MRIAARRNRRLLRIEPLEMCTLMSAAPLAASAATAPGDTVIPIHAQVNNNALDVVLGVATDINTIEQAVDAYLDEVPGWHLTGDVNKTPTYSGEVDGSLVLGPTGMLQSANVTLTGSASMAASIQGYYGISVLHVGVGTTADLSANVNASASYNLSTNAWSFGGSASLTGYVKGSANAMLWPLQGEVYIQAAVSASAAISAKRAWPRPTWRWSDRWAPMPRSRASSAAGPPSPAPPEILARGRTAPPSTSAPG